MEIKLFDNGKIFYIQNKSIIEKTRYLYFIKETYNVINSFSNNNYIIKYDNLICYSYNKNLVVIGDNENLKDIINDLFYRNLLVDYILTENIKFVNEAKELLNLDVKVVAENKYAVKLTNIRRTVFSGGCFWCMAHPYYTFDGVIKVLSGYSGGKSLNPTYLETKHGNGYRESVLIVFDNTKISYFELLKLYFESIDPFDSEGQFIDKGHSYTTCVYYKSNAEIADFNNIRKDIETRFKCPVKVALEPDCHFYMAEDEHQEFEFKFKTRFEKEEEESGRNKFNYVKIN